MPEIINLRQARKRRERDRKRKSGDANAALHGLKKSEKERARKLSDIEKARLEGHRREKDEDET